jgi:hypothetical protein
MTNFVNRVFHLREGETSLVVILGILLLINSMARQITNVVAISGFLDTGDVNSFLIVLAIDYLLILLMGGLQSLIVDRFDRVKLMSALCVGFALIFVFLRLLFSFGVHQSVSYAVMYIISEQQFVFFPLFFWVMANDIFDMSQSKRLFPVIASWSFVGKLLGLGVTYLTPDIFERVRVPQEDVLLINVMIYLIAYMLIFIGLRAVKLRKTVQQTETLKETLTEGWGFVREVFSFRFLMIAITALAICDTIIEFRFLVVTDAVIAGGAEYQKFYSLYRLVATLLAFAMQSFLTSRIIEKVNIKNAFFIFPIVALGSAVSMIAFPGLVTAVVAMVLVKLVRETVDESSRKSFQALVPEERRGRVSVFMDSYLPAIGTILGCLVAYGIVLLGMQLGQTSFQFSHYLWLVVAGGVLAVWAIYQMRGVYDSSLLNWRLKRRQRGASVLDNIEF